MSALQGGGKRGHRVDAESAAGGHLIPVQAFRKSARVNADPESAETWVDDGLANTLNSFDVGDVRTTHAVVQATAVGGDIAHTLTHEGHDASEDGTGRGTPVVATAIGFSHTQGLDPQAREEMRPTLRTNGGGQAVAFSHYSSDPSPGDVSPTMRSGTNVSGHAVAQGPAVRRLTPLECERLQAWPEVDGRGWTDIPWNGKEHAPDSKRYAACGNGVTSTVAYWIAARLAEVLK